MKLTNYLKRIFKSRNSVINSPEGSSPEGGFIPIATFLRHLQKGLYLSGQDCDVENNQFISEYLVEVSQPDSVKNLGELLSEMDLAISSQDFMQARNILAKIRAKEESKKTVTHQLKTISLELPHKDPRVEVSNVVEVPLLLLTSFPIKKMKQLTMKISLEFVVNDEDVVCIRLPKADENGMVTSRSLEHSYELTELEVVFDADKSEQDLQDLIDNFESLGRKQAEHNASSI